MDQVKQHSKAKYLPTHTQTPQWKRGFPPPPPQHRGLSDQRSDLQCLSHRGRRENTQIHMYKPVRHTHYITLHTYQLKRLLAELTHQQTVMYFPAEGGREGQQAAEAGRVRRDMRSARSPSLYTFNIQFSSATDKQIKQACWQHKPVIWKPSVITWNVWTFSVYINEYVQEWEEMGMYLQYRYALKSKIRA